MGKVVEDCNTSKAKCKHTSRNLSTLFLCVHVIETRHNVLTDKLSQLGEDANVFLLN